MTTLIQHTNQANGRPTTMTKQQTTTTPSMNQAPALPASEANPTLENFLSVVFGEIPKDERGLFWASTKEAPGYPVEKTKFDRLMGGKGQRAAYFGTATMYPNDEGKLRNKQDLFAAQYVVVLDDIGAGLGAKVLEKELPDFIKDSLAGHIACVSGAEKISDYVQYVKDAGFKDVTIESKSEFPLELMLGDPQVMKLAKAMNFSLASAEAKDIASSVTSISLSAKKHTN